MKLGIFGYGNLGKAAETVSEKFSDIEISGIFTRRNPKEVKSLKAPVYSASDVEKYKDSIDVLFIAGGSATDLPALTPQLAREFNVIDSFDNHSIIDKHFDNVNKSALETGHIALISAGWDPGLFSIARLYTQSIMPDGKTYTFWGRGVSQGHSDAIRRIKGVKDARQYTIPIQDVLNSVKNGINLDLNAKTMHIRDCYVVAEDCADKTYIENQIRTMPAYFEGYKTNVTFISQEEMKANHSTLPHGGCVIRNGKTSKSTSHTASFSLNLQSNPQFTSSVIMAYARAIYKMHKEGKTGCFTVFDVAPKYLSDLQDDALRHSLL